MVIDPTNLVAGTAALVTLPAFVAYWIGYARGFGRCAEARRSAKQAAHLAEAHRAAWEEQATKLKVAARTFKLSAEEWQREAEAWKARAAENDGALRLRDGSLVGWN